LIAATLAYEHLDVQGGAESILDIVERGLKHRDAQFERYLTG
jgi:hypothetical protein